MRVMRKSRISVALAAALAGVGASTQVSAVNISQDEIGDVLIFPYYTVRGGFSTGYTLINTSDRTVVAKVRFHEGVNSRDVLDFTVAFSPRDRISFSVAEKADGSGPRATFAGLDTTCVSPIPNDRNAGGGGGWLDFSNNAYIGSDEDGYDQDVPGNTTQRKASIDRAREGYMVVIEEGRSDSTAPTSVAFNATHVGNPPKPRSCAAVDAAFQTANIQTTYAEFSRNVNALKGDYGVTNAVRGIEAGGGAVALANFATEDSLVMMTQTSVSVENANVTTQLGLRDQRAVELDQLELALQTAVNGCGLGTSVTSPGQIPPNFAGVVAAPPPPYTIVAPSNSANPNLGINATVTTPPTGYTTFVFNANPGTAGVGGLGVACVLPGPALTNLQQALVDYNAGVDNWVAAVRAARAAVVRQLMPPRNLISDQQSPRLISHPNLDDGDVNFQVLIDAFYNTPQAPALAWNEFPRPALYMGSMIRGVDAVTALLMRNTAVNEWANFNPNTGAYGDWVLTAPTKAFYSDLDFVYKNEPHAQFFAPWADQVLGLVDGWPPFSNGFDPDNGGACDTVNVRLWGIDEQTPNPGTQPSPLPHLDLCWETNLITFNGVAAFEDTKLNVDVNTNQNTANGPLGTNGWMQLIFGDGWSAEHYHPAVPNLGNIVPAASIPLPVPPYFDGNGIAYDGIGDPVYVLRQQNWLMDLDYSLPKLATGSYSPPGSIPAIDQLTAGGAAGTAPQAQFSNVTLAPGGIGHLVQLGMPEVGFRFHVRDLNSPSSAYADTFPHSWTRAFELRNATGGTAGLQPPARNAPYTTIPANAQVPAP